jgi:hypothetical protein
VIASLSVPVTPSPSRAARARAAAAGARAARPPAGASRLPVARAAADSGHPATRVCAPLAGAGSNLRVRLPPSGVYTGPPPAGLWHSASGPLRSIWARLATVSGNVVSHDPSLRALNRTLAVPKLVNLKVLKYHNRKPGHQVAVPKYLRGIAPVPHERFRCTESQSQSSVQSQS